MPCTYPVRCVFAVGVVLGVTRATEEGEGADGPADAELADHVEAREGEVGGEVEEVGGVEEGEGVGVVEVVDGFGVAGRGGVSLIWTF